MDDHASKLYTWVLEISTLVLTVALVWFAFVYYPRVVNDYQSGKVLPSRSLYKPVYAEVSNFPIETEAYRIVYEDKSATYYVFVQGERLDEYVFNRDNAKLALKTALSIEDTCSLSIIYASANNLKIPQKYGEPTC